MLFALVIGYFCGSLPFGVWVAKAHGVNIFEVGSRKSGATNVLRTVGKRAGYTVFLLDVLKGMTAVGVGMQLQAPYASLFGAMVGHSFSCWIRFKGGKSVATTIGGLFLLIPLPVLSGLVLWFLIFKWLRYVSCASLFFVLSLFPFCCLYYGVEAARPHALPLLVIILLVIYLHRENLIRLWQGKENRF